MSAKPVSRPWYREPWLWIVIAGPAAVVAAGIATIAIAVVSSDGVVADDYYKQGLAINRTMERDARARALGVAARIAFNEERTGVRVTFAANAPPPKALVLKLVHPTRAGEDQAVELAHAGPSLYEGRLQRPRAGSWRVVLEDPAGGWRIAGRWGGAQPSIVLGDSD